MKPGPGLTALVPAAVAAGTGSRIRTPQGSAAADIYTAVFDQYTSDVLLRLACTEPILDWRRRLGLGPLLRRLALGTKLYVGNLSYGVSSSDLQQLFAAFGTVRSAEVITDRDTGRSKGFGFVEMSSDEEAQAAIQGLNGQERDGRAMTVNEARPREERPGGGGGRGGRGGYGGGGGGRGGRGGRY